MATLTVLRKGVPFTVLLDDADLPLFAGRRLKLLPNGYVVYSYKRDGKTHTVYVHRVVMGVHGECHFKKTVDHANHDRLDNRKSNLRIVPHYRNIQHRKGPQANNKLGVRGVCWCSWRQQFMGSVKLKGKSVSKRFDTLADAEAWVITKRAELDFLTGT